MKAAVLKSPGSHGAGGSAQARVPAGRSPAQDRGLRRLRNGRQDAAAGSPDLAYPRILGHEIVGRIVEIDNDCGLEEGDLCQVWPGIACGSCGPCLRGADNRCRSMKIMGFNCDGGFAEYMALPAQSLSRGANLLPENFDPALGIIGRAPGLLHKRPGADKGLGRRCRPDLRRRSHRRSSCPPGRTAGGWKGHSSRKIARAHSRDRKAHSRQSDRPVDGSIGQSGKHNSEAKPAEQESTSS